MAALLVNNFFEKGNMFVFTGQNLISKTQAVRPFIEPFNLNKKAEVSRYQMEDISKMIKTDHEIVE